MPMLFQASLPRASKAVLVCLFGCGLFVTVAATLRIALVAVEVHNFHAIGFWSVRESMSGETLSFYCFFLFSLSLHHPPPLSPFLTVPSFHPVGSARPSTYIHIVPLPLKITRICDLES